MSSLLVIINIKLMISIISGDREICGNGIVEGDEVCDCGSDDTAECDIQDPCCTTNCTLKPMTQCT